MIAGAGGDGSHVDITVKKIKRKLLYRQRSSNNAHTQPETKTVSIEDKAFLATQVKAITGQTSTQAMLDQLYSSYSASGLSTGEYIKKFKEILRNSLKRKFKTQINFYFHLFYKISSGITYDQPVYIPVEERTTTNANDQCR